MTTRDQFISEIRGKLILLEKIIGWTPLYELKFPEFDTNRVFVKTEFNNPSGSHYDRVYLELFKELLNNNKASSSISENSYLMEISSGNAGISFAFFCKYLGFKNAELILPVGIPINTIQIIKSINPELKISQPEPLWSDKYLQGCVEYLKEKKLKSEPIFLNHSRKGKTLEATKNIASESIAQLINLGIEKIDYFIAACGNGSTIVGPGAILKEKYPSIKIIIFEPKQAPVGYSKKYNTSINSDNNNPYKHKLYGTGAWGIKFPFIHEDNYGFCKIVDEVILVDDKYIDDSLKLKYKLPFSVGYTSLVGLHIILNYISEKKCQNSVFLTIFYDTGEKYEI
jgi:cysteine synthase A